MSASVEKAELDKRCAPKSLNNETPSNSYSKVGIGRGFIVYGFRLKQSLELEAQRHRNDATTATVLLEVVEVNAVERGARRRA